MRITILAAGSRGDVQPTIALGLGLQRAGHCVTVAASLVFESFVRDYGLAFAPVHANIQEFLKQPQVQQLLRHPNPVRLFRDFGPLFESLMGAFDDFWRASQGADALVVSPGALGGYDCAERLGIPVFLALLQPLNPTDAFPTFFLPYRLPLGPFTALYNRASHRLFEQALWQAVRVHLNRWRQATLGLPALGILADPYRRMRNARVPFLFGYSPTLVPKPHDWAAEHAVTGYWFLDAPPGWQPPVELARFLEAGAPPVYVGFGSMSDEKPEALTHMALDALKMTGQRGVLHTGWTGLGGADLPSTVLQTGSIPHDWLFPRMAAVVHHGGAGTTGAGLHAGVPSILTPFMMDQFAWAKAVTDLGAGPPCMPVKTLTADKLAAALRAAVSDKSLRRRAAELGAIVRAEDGVGCAVETIQQYLKEAEK